MTPWLVLAAILVAAHTVETILGFGSTILALSLGAHLFPLEKLMGTLVTLGLVQSTWLIARGWRVVDWRGLGLRILPLAALGGVAGVALRGVFTASHLKLALGLFVSVLAVWELAALWAKTKPHARLPWWKSAPMLAAGGVFHGLFGTGGPMIVYVASREFTEPAVFRATLSVLWLILNLALLGQLIYSGVVTAEQAMMTGAILPATLTGIAIGSRLKPDARTFHILTYVVLLVAGLFLIF